MNPPSFYMMNLRRIPLAPGQPHLEPLAERVLGEEGAAQLVVAGQGALLFKGAAAEVCAAKGHAEISSVCTALPTARNT